MENLTFAVVGDLHVGATAEEVQAVIRLVNSQPVEFALFLGDLVHEADDRYVEEFATEIAKINKPVYLTLGNHDTGKMPEGYDIEGKIGDAFPGPWSECFTYGFQVKGWNFIVGGVGVGRIPYEGVQVNRYKGYVSEKGNILYMPGAHLERFRELLAESGQRPTCVVLHVPLVRMAERVHDRGCYDQVRLLEEIQVLSLVEQRPNVKVALYGHQHFNQVDVLAGRLHCVTQGIRGMKQYGDPNAVRIMQFTPAGVSSRLIWDGDPGQPPAPIGTIQGDRCFEWPFDA